MQIIAQTSSSQYGMQTIDICSLGKYVQKSYNKIKKEIEQEFEKELSKEVIEKLTNTRLEKEVISGIQMLEYQINTLITSNGRTPNVAWFLNINSDDSYANENAILIEEILKRRYKGIKSENGEYITTDFPKLIYVLNEENSLQGGKYDYLTKMAMECVKKRQAPYFISAKKMKENYGQVFAPIEITNFLEPWKDENGDYKYNGRFNQGVVTLNLPQIGIIADGDEEKFWSLLDERLEICKEALMCKHYAMLGTLSQISPIQWNYGAIARLDKEETIDKLLKNGYSTLSLGYIGICEVTKLVKSVSNTEKEGNEFAIKILKYLNEKVKEWKKETSLGFVLCQTQDLDICKSFIKNDREEYGEIKCITDKEYYSSSYCTLDTEEIDILKKLEFENEYQKLTPGGAITYMQTSKIDNFEELAKYIYNNIQYVGFIK